LDAAVESDHNGIKVEVQRFSKFSVGSILDQKNLTTGSSSTDAVRRPSGGEEEKKP
jgi:hypothetical protein